MGKKIRTGTSAPGSPQVDVLIDRIRRGDPRAFSRLVAEIEPFVSGSSLKVCRDRDVASENAQDTFINVYRKLHQFDGTSKFTTWLYSIIVNNCRMKRRRRLLEKATVSTDDIAEEQIDAAQKSESSAYGADRKLLLDELQTVLGSAVETLPQEYRSVFVLRDLENHTTEETAHMLGLSIAAVKSRLHRARARVREHLELYLTVGE